MQSTTIKSSARKRIAITGKRQVTIPIEFYRALNLGSEAECYVQNGALVIRPASEARGGEFAEEILAELIQEGYGGERLMREFRKRNRAMRGAVEKLIEEADAAAAGLAPYERMEDVFKMEEA